MVVNALFSAEENVWSMTSVINQAYAKAGAHVEDVEDKVGELALLVGSNPGIRKHQ